MLARLPANSCQTRFRQGKSQTSLVPPPPMPATRDTCHVRHGLLPREYVCAMLARLPASVRERERERERVAILARCEAGGWRGRKCIACLWSCCVRPLSCCVRALVYRHTTCIACLWSSVCTMSCLIALRRVCAVLQLSSYQRTSLRAVRDAYGGGELGRRLVLQSTPRPTAHASSAATRIVQQSRCGDASVALVPSGCSIERHARAPAQTHQLREGRDL
jgi:hypothetical protein